MAQSPITVTYPLEEVLTRIEGKIDDNHKDIGAKLERIDERLTKLEAGQARLESDVSTLKEGVKDIKGSQLAQIWTLITILGTAVVGTVIRFVITAPGGNP